MVHDTTSQVVNYPGVHPENSWGPEPPYFLEHALYIRILRMLELICLRGPAREGELAQATARAVFEMRALRRASARAEGLPAGL